MGSIVLYEAACRGESAAAAISTRGSRLLGVIVDDLGPGTGAQYKVRFRGESL